VHDHCHRVRAHEHLFGYSLHDNSNNYFHHADANLDCDCLWAKLRGRDGVLSWAHLSQPQPIFSDMQPSHGNPGRLVLCVPSPFSLPCMCPNRVPTSEIHDSRDIIYNSAWSPARYYGLLYDTISYFVAKLSATWSLLLIFIHIIKPNIHSFVFSMTVGNPLQSEVLPNASSVSPMKSAFQRKIKVSGSPGHRPCGHKRRVLNFAMFRGITAFHVSAEA
jgi:hypothetical protein